MPAPVPLKASATRTRNIATSNSRIPLEYCDGPTQRLYAVSAFVILQAIKLYYWQGIVRSDYAAEFFGFILWLALDVLFLIGLNYLRIPWLELPVLRLILALFFLTILNFVLFTAREISPTAIARSSASKVWGYVRAPVLSAGEGARILDQDEHLLGRHTVLIKPYSSATLNPDEQCFCIPNANLQIIEQPRIPIMFNGSEPNFIEYSITSFETGATTTHKAKGPFKDSSSILQKVRSTQEEGHSIFTLRAQASGAYKLVKILDKDEVDIRFSKGKEVFVVGCPEARIDRYKENLDRCSGKGVVEVPIVVRGLPPWRVTYTKRSLTTMETSHIESEPADYSSPLLKGWSPPAQPNYSWATQHEMNLTVHLPLANPGQYDFQVTKVRDGCGNVIDLHSLVSRGLREPEIRHVNVRARPVVTMECDPRKPVKIVSLGANPTTNIGLNIKHGRAPYQIGYVYQKDDIDAPQPRKDLFITQDGVDKAHIVADRPGLYTLSHVKDDFCEGEVELPRDCSVTVAGLPAVDLSTTTIEDQCVGAIGVSIALTFTGEGPWQVCYDVWRNDRLEKEDVCKSSFKPRLTLKMTPELSGTFQYNFKSVSDKNYKHVKVDLPPVLQNIHPQPSASFIEGRSSVKACRGSTKNLGVQLVGKGPWDIKYQVIHRGQSRVFTQTDISTSTANLTLPPFDEEGTYSVDLESVTDRANGCTKALSVSDVVIQISNGPPTVSFQCETPIEYPEGGSVDIPIHLTGGAPWELSYGLEGQGTMDAVTSDSRNALINVRQPGVFELRSVKDAFCEGEVVEQARKCLVVQSERPTMNLKIDSIRFRGGPRGNVPEDEISPSELISEVGDHFVLPAVCKDAERSLDFRLTGKEPFELKYKRIYRPIRGSEETTLDTIVVHHSTMRLPVITDRAGTITYQLLTLSDAQYKNVDVQHENHTVVFKHDIRKPPAASIVHNKKQHYCKNEITGVSEKVPIKIQDGVGPYTLVIEIQRPNQPADKVRVHDVVPIKGVYEWALPAKFAEIGSYVVSVLRISDANGCSSTDRDEASSIEFEILDTPSITPKMSITDGCVGDKIDYTLQGEAPFKVHYSLGKTNSVQTLPSKKFTYLATKPGELRITRVCQTVGRKECCTRPLEDLKATIWALPSAKIAGGTNHITNLRDGDRAEIEVTFEGEPPFAFGYVRKEPETHLSRLTSRLHKSGKILKREKVENIDDRKYSFFVVAAGTFELTFIKDKHCQFVRDV